MALGGVETGNAIASEQDKATVVANIMLLSPGITITIGMSKFAAAVLLINVDSTTPNKQNKAIKINPCC